MAVVAVVIIAGVFVLNKGDDDDEARDLAKGDMLEYTVFGSIDTEFGYDEYRRT